MSAPNEFLTCYTCGTYITRDPDRNVFYRSTLDGFGGLDYHEKCAPEGTIRTSIVEFANTHKMDIHLNLDTTAVLRREADNTIRDSLILYSYIHRDRNRTESKDLDGYEGCLMRYHSSLLRT